MDDQKSLEEDEPDYMSDEFLAKCVPKDVRPSLLYSTSGKRKHDLLEKQKKTNEAYSNRWKPVRVQEQEAREVGLQTPIGTENKGFQLLQKMGYKPGTSIGKNCHNDDALKEPIPLELKKDRIGLGKKTKLKEQIKIQAERQIDFKKLCDPNQFRSRIQAAASQKECERDLRKAQSTCRSLDIDNNIEQPPETWYWPKPEKLKNHEDDVDEKQAKSIKVVELDDNEEDEPLTPEKVQQQLKLVTKYLRERYLYCIWCGTSYETEQEYDQLCPGVTKEDH